MLFFGTAGGEVHAVSTVDGTTIYRVEAGVGATSAAPVVFADKLLVGNGEGRLFLFNCFSGERVAESDVLAGAGIMGSLLTDQYLVVANKKGLIARFD
jgi:outer membrane protein assembly factor BamB